MSIQQTAILAAIAAAVSAVCMIKIHSRISRLLADAEAGWRGVVIESRRRADTALDILEMPSAQRSAEGAAAAASAIRAIDDAFTREEQIDLELRLDSAMDEIVGRLPSGEGAEEYARAARVYRQDRDCVDLARRYYDGAAARANAASRALIARIVCPVSARSPLPMFRTTQQRREADAAP